MPIRRLTFRLYPTKQQEEKLFYARRLHAYLYNACIAHRRDSWRANRKSVSYFTQQNCLPAFREIWSDYKQLNLMTLQATVKRVDLAYNAFLKGIRKRPKFKSIHKYSGWTYPDGRQGFKVQVQTTQRYAVNCGWVNLNDLDCRIRIRGRFKYWGKPKTCTIVYKPHSRQWFASFTVKTENPEPKYGSQSDLKYEDIIAYDLGTKTALTCYNGSEFEEIKNPRFDREFAPKIRKAGMAKRRKQVPIKGKQKASKRYIKAAKREGKLRSKQSRVRADWQHKVTTDLASRYDIVVTEQLNTRGITRKSKKRKKQKAGLNRSILDVGFATLNQMVTYKVLSKGGILVEINTRKLKPSQRCPECWKVNQDWADLSERYHQCSCGFGGKRDQTSAVVMYLAATGVQSESGTDFVKRRSSSSTDSSREHTGGMRQLGEKKRQKSQIPR